MNQVLRCAHCGDVIGVYEPLVIVDQAGMRLSSRAAEPGLVGDLAEHYHRSCHETPRARDAGADARDQP
jgi:hypothetical protein